MDKQNWNPGKLLEVSGGFWQACALHTSVKLDLFTVLDDESLESREIAGRLEVDERALSMLLNALTAMGLLVKSDDLYANAPAARSYLCRNSPEYLGYMIKHHCCLIESWTVLDQAIRSGKPVRGRSSFSNDEARESFIMGMFTIASLSAPGVADEIDLSDRRHLLDLGGGPGTYSIYFCMRNPGLTATVFDLPTTRSFAEKTIARLNLSDRIEFIDGNYLENDVPGRYDAAWLSHILHAEGPEGCEQIISKAVAALEPGGIIMVHDFILDNTMDGPLFPALFSLNMLLGTEGGQAYSEEQIMAMLSHQGVQKIRRLPFKGPTDSGIITGLVS